MGRKDKFALVFIGCAFLASCNKKPTSEEKDGFKVIWQNYNGQTLETDYYVEEGTMPSYDSATPIKQSDEYSYRFIGWDKELDVVKGDITYTAQFEIDAERKTVRWYDAEGNILKEAYFYDDEPQFDLDYPTKAGYIFDKFELHQTDERNVIAYYPSFIEKHKRNVQYMSDGKVIYTTKVVDGELPEEPEDPVKESDNEYDYKFIGWSLVSIDNNDLVYRANYSFTARKYNVTWKDSDGTILETSTRTYNQNITRTPRNPFKDADDKYNYKFDKWISEYEEEGKDITFIASYIPTPKRLYVRFVNYDGKVLRNSSYCYGDTFDPLEKGKDLTPKRNSENNIYYLFDGFSKDEDIVEDGFRYEIYKASYIECKMVKDGNFTFIENPDKLSYRLNSVSGFNLKEVTIPETVEGLPVTIIDSNAFLQVSDALYTVTLPSTLQEIRNDAFSGCEKLFEIYNLSNLDIKLDSDNLLFGNINKVALAIHKSKEEPSIYTTDDNGFVFAYANCKGYLVGYDSDKCANLDITLPNNFTYNGNLIDEYEIYYAFSVVGFDKLVIPNSKIIIGNHAFTSCYFKELSMLNSPSSIGTYAFNNCIFDSLTIPDTVTEISSYAFYQSYMKNLVIGENVKTIGENAFRGVEGLLEAYNLSDVDLSEKQYGLDVYYIHKAIEPSVFVKDEDGFLFAYINEVGYLFSYDPKGSYPDLLDISLPDSFTINGKTINSYKIRHEAFSSIYEIKSVYIPDSVTSIGYMAFESCKNLKTVVMPKNLEIFASSVFQGCSSLESVTLPENIEDIPSSLFSGCFKLKDIKIPNSVKTIYSDAFKGCAIENITFGEELEHIGSYAFEGCPIVSVRLPKSLKYYYNPFPSSLQNIFYDGTIDTWASIEFYRAPLGHANLYLLDSNGDVSFDGKTYSILGKDLVFNDAKVIKTNAFAYFEIDSVEFKQVERIERTAFYNSTLTSIKLPSTVKYVGDAAFDTNRSNPIVYFEGTLLDWLEIDFVSSIDDDSNKYFKDSNSNYSKVEELVIPEGVEVIKGHAFSGFKDLKKVVLPDSIKEIGSLAFHYCISLEEINLPSGLEKIGSGAFWDCRKLDNVVIPDTVKELKHLTFSSCSSLTNVSLPNDIKSIQWSCFSSCISLKSIKLPDSLETIEKDAFYRTSLSEIVIPDNVTLIGERAFGMCNRLESITLPNSVSKLDRLAFYSCNNLKTIEFTNNLKEIGVDAFYETYTIEKVYYHGTKEEYDNIKFNSYCSNPAWLKALVYVLDSDGNFTLYKIK